MNTPMDSTSDDTLDLHLHSFHGLCEDVLNLVSCENQALSASGEYKPDEFNGRRKRLIPELEMALMHLRNQRRARQQNAYPEGIKTMFQAIQNLLTRILLLDRNNQQALLHRGLVPAAHLPKAAAQKPHYVAGLYQRHSPG